MWHISEKRAISSNFGKCLKAIVHIVIEVDKVQQHQNSSCVCPLHILWAFFRISGKLHELLLADLGFIEEKDYCLVKNKAHKGIPLTYSALEYNIAHSGF